MKRKAQDDRPIMPPGKLTAVAVRNATKRGLYGDGLGLYLQVSTFGTKSWIFRFMLDGVARKMGLGAVHTVSLAEAREDALAARSMVRKGIDPIEAQKDQRAHRKLEAAKAITFGRCADAYIKANESTWKNDKHIAQWRATFEETRRGKRVFPAATAVINDLSIADVDTGLVRKVLEPIWYSTPETASRVRGRIERVLAWATVAGYRSGDNPARWTGHLKELLPAKTKVSAVIHHSAVPYVDMPAFMRDLRAKSGLSARALEFCILTATRTGEVIVARPAEIDYAKKVWTIPAERMKAAREHEVPLSDRALAILAGPSDGEFVFGGRNGRPLSNMAMLELLRGMLGKGATVHGFRSTFRDWAGNETHFPRELAEHALAHVIGDKAEQAYRRSAALEKRRKLMSAWSAYCERSPVETSKVVQFRELA
jgi:integrase